MWLAADAAGASVAAWPVDAAGRPGPPVVAATLDGLAPAGPVVVDGAAAAPVLRCPVAIDAIRAVPGGRAFVVPFLEDGRAQGRTGAGRLVGALELGRWRDGPERGRLVCACAADGIVAWAYAGQGRFQRLGVTAAGAALEDLLRRAAVPDAADEDDDVAFERGLTIARDARDLDGDLDRVLAQAQAGRLRRGAVGAALAGVLVGHDAARGLGLGRLGAPVLLVGAGLLADRYAIALGRFGVAVRRIDPLRALVAGCQAAAAGNADFHCAESPQH